MPSDVKRLHDQSARRNAGSAICRRLVHDVAGIALAYGSNAEPAEALAAEIVSGGGTARAFGCDMAGPRLLQGRAHGLAHFLGSRVAADGVTVNVLAPGFIETAIISHIPWPRSVKAVTDQSGLYAEHRHLIRRAAARSPDPQLDPDVVLRVDRSAAPPCVQRVVRGAAAVAARARAFSKRSQFTRLALVNGVVGLVFAPRGRLLLALSFTTTDGKIVEIDILADPARLRQLTLAVLND